MSTQLHVSQRDLRLRSKEIMDAVAGGQSFTVTRDGHEIAELIPLRARRRFVSREAFAAGSRTLPDVDALRWRDDISAAVDGELDDPYARATLPAAVDGGPDHAR